MVEKSLVPKRRPAYLSREERGPDFVPSKEEQAGYTFSDTEFRADMEPLLKEDPISKLGFDITRMQYDIPEGARNAHYMSPYDDVTYDYMMDSPVGEYKLKSDTIHYGPDFGASKDTIAHEARHRGFQLLRDMQDEDPEWFESTFGSEASLMLDREIYKEEFVNELFDNPDATYIEPTTGKKSSTEQLFDSADPESVRKYRETGVLENNSHPEIITKGVSGLRKAAEYMLNAKKENKFSKGGTTMKDQMSMFEEGGLKQEGGMIDEESGNEVPVGSTREEVRDDIDAKLSEGEFIFPADVTRYIGLDKLMQLRQQAKRGLQKMEAMGQMGNSDEATMDDDMPFGMEDLIIISAEREDEPQKFAAGGMPVDPNTGVYYTGNTGVTMQQPIYQPPTAPVQPVPTAPTQPVATQPTATPTGGYTPLFGTAPQQPQEGVSFGNLMAGTELTYKTYVNEAGDSILVPFIGDNPMYPIPEGYVLATGLDESGRPIAGEATDTTETDTTTPEEPKPAERGDYGPPADTRSEFQKAGGWSMDTSTPEGMQRWIDEANKINTQGNIVAGIMGAINPLMGAAVWAGNAYSKKQILSGIDDKIKNAKTAEQRAALQKIKDDLISGKNKGILGTIVDKITTALGLKPEEKKAAVSNVVKAAGEVSAASKDKTINGITPDPKTMSEEWIKQNFKDGEFVIPTDSITKADGTTATQALKDAGYNTPKEYAKAIADRIQANRDVVAKAQEQNELNAAAMAAEDAQMQQILSSGAKPAKSLADAQAQFEKIPSVTPKTLAEMQAEAETIAAPKVVTAADKAASDAAAIALKTQNVTKDTITKEQFEKIKDSEDAKKMFNISPEATSIEEVKQETTTTRNITPVSTLGTSLIGAGMELGKDVFAPEVDTASARDQLVQDYVTKYLESDVGKNVTDRLTKGEDVSVNEIADYLQQVQQQEMLDTGTRIAPETGATAAERDAFYKEKAAREEAERIAREEAARKAAEEAARKATAEAAARKAAEEAARKAAAEKAAAQRAREIAAQKAASQSVSSYRPPSGVADRGDYGPTGASGVKQTYKGTTTPQKTETAKAATTGLSSSQKKGGAALDTAFGISGLAKGGLASMKAKKTAKYTKSRGIAARKK